jgi:hypothetical protein
MGDDDLDFLHVGHYRRMTTDVATGLSRATARLVIPLSGRPRARQSADSCLGSAATCRASTGGHVSHVTGRITPPGTPGTVTALRSVLAVTQNQGNGREGVRCNAHL